ncbi:acyl-CoA dehydrogenase [Actinoplanes sp. NPDC051633]|uniref:acyl-CoA dehydrogenase n=1 Tax=Actinoplanes sp. NPDC051633 TaxID=3155670 RepID=UPI00341C1D85
MAEAAAKIAEEVLFPAAAAVDRSDRVPAGHLDLLADAGFYDRAGDDLPEVVEILASGCLATTFVWIQHLSPLFTAGAALRGRRAGIAYAGLAPGSDLHVQGGRLSGHVPWVTGWDLIDVVQVAVREGDQIRYYLLDAVAGPTLEAELQELVAVQASRTVSLTFDGHPVPEELLVHTEDYEPWSQKNASGSSLNGFLSLGLVRRVSRLLDGAFDDELTACRALLADQERTPQARAAASALAWKAAGALVTRTGSGGIRAGETAQRLAREAAFLLVFASRPSIRTELYRRMTS